MPAKPQTVNHEYATLNKLTFLNPVQPFQAAALQPWKKPQMDPELAESTRELNAMQKLNLARKLKRWAFQLRLAAMADNSASLDKVNKTGLCDEKWEDMLCFSSVPDRMRFLEDMENAVAQEKRCLSFMATFN